MTLAEARALGSRFGLAPIERLEAIPHGSVNSNFRVTLEDGSRAFVRVCEESNFEQVQQQNRLLLHLVASGVQTPSPLLLSDGSGSVALHRGKPATAFEYCVGDWVCQRLVSPQHVRLIGAEVARIHLAGESVAHDAPSSRFGFEQLRVRVEQLDGGCSEDIEQALVLLRSRLDQLAAVANVGPHVVHGDVFRDNELWHDPTNPAAGLSALLDFESASVGHPAFDLMVTLLAWCCGNELERPLVQALVAGYQSVRPLSQPELAACYDQARAACVRFAITRITDYELRPEGVVVYKDYRRFLQRLHQIESVGSGEFVAWMQ